AKKNFILALCLQRDRKPLQPEEGRVLARSEFHIREHQHAGLTKNAKVCLHAGASLEERDAFL
ncbi:hypothetical protein ABE044_04555, partial [Bacillus altitudinis]|uniref:hypothetical protein n=1 Tax=Bacillus altitudinis TaxID=293387 RepID=UPI003D251AC1